MKTHRHLDHVVRLNMRPSSPPPQYLEVTGTVISGKTVLLMPVNKMNKLPKSLKLNVQGEFDFVNYPGEKIFLVGPDGRVYACPQDEHHIVHKKGPK